MQSAISQPACRMQATRPVNRAFTVAVQAKTRTEARKDRHARLRRKLSGTTERPRLAVYRSNEHIYAQVIDDTKGHTLAAANTLMKDFKEMDNTANCSAAEAIGKKIAELCTAKNITKVAFDRGGNPYTGRVKAVAEAARAGGLVF